MEKKPDKKQDGNENGAWAQSLACLNSRKNLLSLSTSSSQCVPPSDAKSIVKRANTTFPQADADLLSAFPDDDEDAEGMDEYFYSAVSPRECASPTSIPRNHSLERLNFLEEAVKQLEVTHVIVSITL